MEYIFFIIAFTFTAYLIPIDTFSFILISFLLLHIVFQVGAVFSILMEDLFYSNKEKLIRIALAIFVPIIGISLEFFTSRKNNKRIKKDTGGEDTITGGPEGIILSHTLWNNSTSDSDGGGSSGGD